MGVYTRTYGTTNIGNSYIKTPTSKSKQDTVIFVNNGYNNNCCQGQNNGCSKQETNMTLWGAFAGALLSAVSQFFGGNQQQVQQPQQEIKIIPETKPETKTETVSVEDQLKTAQAELTEKGLGDKGYKVEIKDGELVYSYDKDGIKATGSSLKDLNLNIEQAKIIAGLEDKNAKLEAENEALKNTEKVEDPDPETPVAPLKEQGTGKISLDGYQKASSIKDLTPANIEEDIKYNSDIEMKAVDAILKRIVDNYGLKLNNADKEALIAEIISKNPSVLDKDGNIKAGVENFDKLDIPTKETLERKGLDKIEKTDNAVDMKEVEGISNKIDEAVEDNFGTNTKLLKEAIGDITADNVVEIANHYQKNQDENLYETIVDECRLDNKSGSTAEKSKALYIDKILDKLTERVNYSDFNLANKKELMDKIDVIKKSDHYATYGNGDESKSDDFASIIAKINELEGNNKTEAE
ncbi:MAG: hypothetical protein R3Y28_05860 [Candidatus Gastranaerophilales bacterium]